METAPVAILAPFHVPQLSVQASFLPTELCFFLKGNENLCVYNVLHVECAFSQQIPLRKLRQALIIILILQTVNLRI